MKKFTFFFILLLTLVPGCQIAPFAGPIVTGVVMWKDGEAHKYYNEESTPMCRVTRSALKELNLPVTKEEPVKGGFFLVAGDKDRFKIHILEVRPHITKISIRVNMLGDKPFAELLYKTIDNSTDTIDFNNGRPVRGRAAWRLR